MDRDIRLCKRAIRNVNMTNGTQRKLINSVGHREIGRIKKENRSDQI